MIAKIFAEISDELDRADAKHPPMAEKVEGFYTLKCEVTELEREIHRKNFDEEAAIKEAIQVGAMAVKLLRDCLGGCHGA